MTAHPLRPTEALALKTALPSAVLRNARRESRFGRFTRLLRYRLLIPLKRGTRDPQHTARGVMVGLAWAFTPLIGIQMYLVFLTWLATRRFLKWDFSLVNGIAWTWITNVVTLVPAYYLFFITGRLMLGEGLDLTGAHYDSFSRSMLEGPARDSGFWQSLIAWVDLIFGELGLTLVVGCIPWSIFTAWIGYHLSLRFVRRLQSLRRRRQQERLVIANSNI